MATRSPVASDGNSAATYRSNGAIVGCAAVTKRKPAVRNVRARATTASVISRASNSPSHRTGSGMLADTKIDSARGGAGCIGVKVRGMLLPPSSNRVLWCQSQVTRPRHPLEVFASCRAKVPGAMHQECSRVDARTVPGVVQLLQISRGRQTRRNADKRWTVRMLNPQLPLRQWKTRCTARCLGSFLNASYQHPPPADESLGMAGLDGLDNLVQCRVGKGFITVCVVDELGIGYLQSRHSGASGHGFWGPRPSQDESAHGVTERVVHLVKHPIGGVGQRRLQEQQEGMVLQCIGDTVLHPFTDPDGESIDERAKANVRQMVVQLLEQPPVRRRACG